MNTIFTIIAAVNHDSKDSLTDIKELPDVMLLIAGTGDELVSLGEKFPEAAVVLISLDAEYIDHDNVVSILKAQNPERPVILLVKYLTVNSLKFARNKNYNDVIHLPMQSGNFPALVRYNHSAWKADQKNKKETPISI